MDCASRTVILQMADRGRRRRDDPSSVGSCHPGRTRLSIRVTQAGCFARSDLLSGAIGRHCGMEKGPKVGMFPCKVGTASGRMLTRDYNEVDIQSQTLWNVA